MITSIFTLVAYAQEAGTPAQPQPSALGLFMPFIIIFFIFYFLIIRPQKKRQTEHQQMLDTLKKGDDVVTVGGLIATIADVRDDHYILKLSDNVRVKTTKTSIATCVDRGSPKEEPSK